MAEIHNDFAWSWSRHNSFYECPRKFYWKYYGSWRGWEDEAPEDAALAYRLKQIKSVAMLVGQTLHDVVRDRLRMRPAAGGAVPAQQIRDEVERRVLKRMRESRNRDWERYYDPKRYGILFEDYYGSGIDERDRDTALELVRECTVGLASNIYARRAFGVAKERLRIVDPDDFDAMRIVVDDIVVYACPDLVVADEAGDLHVVDWKTGKPKKADVAQLAMYGLYVTDRMNVPLERIVAHVVYVRSGKVEKHGGLRESVEEARRRISTFTTDVRERLTDVENNLAGDIDRFPMTENLMLCRRCQFQEICDRRQPDPIAPSEDEAESA
ncbi:MAG TPA: PD-(D/E)XK nuclease family protein [Candidatus Eremiobacteraceae bacterium]|nr:PD-(D/E)XK nuclease family protein [Candidatus Eremiobacteraceae bacterium]